MKEIFERRSVRKFAAREVEAEKLEAVLRACMAAPSAGNQRPWEFYIVRDREKLEALSKLSRYAGPIAAAPLAIVTVCDPEGKRFAEVAATDMAACTENLWLGAVSVGLGTVWIGVYPYEERVTLSNQILGIPAGKYVFSILPLGYPAEERTAEDRFDPARIHEL